MLVSLIVSCSSAYKLPDRASVVGIPIGTYPIADPNHVELYGSFRRDFDNDFPGSREQIKSRDKIDFGTCVKRRKRL